MATLENNPLEKVLVIGGGLSGLACACRLRQRGLPVLLLERGPRFGGVIDTVDVAGFRFDVGPQSFLATPPLADWIAELGLEGELLRANSRAPRYILHRGRLVRAPFGPADLLRTPLIGARTKLRLVTEPFHRTYPPDGDESIAAFVRRKFGEDLLANLVSPFVSGVYAGDPEKLSLASALPAVRRFEERYGSVLRGAIKSMRQGGAPGASEGRAPLCNFPRGMRTLIEAAAASLGGDAVCNAEVTTLRRVASQPGTPTSQFDVAYTEAGVPRALTASAIVVAAPAGAAADLLAAVEPLFADPLRQIEYAAVAQVCAGYRLSQISSSSAAASASGFGFLVPRAENLRLLGTVWNSFLFTDRGPQTPEKTATFTSFLGGATDPAIADLSDDEVAALAGAELAKVLGITGPPIAVHVARWRRAIPQYNLGHAGIVAALAELCARTPGIFLAGNYLSGPSMGACVEQAGTAAEAVAQHLGASAASTPTADANT